MFLCPVDAQTAFGLVPAPVIDRFCYRCFDRSSHRTLLSYLSHCIDAFRRLLGKQADGLNVVRSFNEKHTQPLLYKEMVERTFSLKI